MDDELEGLISAIRSQVTELGYELVDLRKRGSQTRPLLQVRVDVPDAATGRGVTHADCTIVSRGLEQWLDETHVLGERYVLEVSSPGIERPIRWAEHWSRFQGSDVKVRLAGRGRVRATIVGVTSGGTSVILRLQGDEQAVTVPLEEARDATLVANWS